MSYPEPRRIEISTVDVMGLTYLELARVSIVADVPQDRRAEQQASYQKTPVNLPYGLNVEGDSSRYGYRASDGGGGFFGMLFGGPRYYQQQPPRPAAQVDRRRRSESSRPLN